MQTVRPSGTPTATPSAPANVLPIGSPLAFILDGEISSSSSKAGDIVKAHLEKALVVEGVTVAPAGTPLEIKVTDASPATNPDIYGFVDIYFRPLTLPDGRVVPLHARISHLNVNVSAGHESTAEAENTIEDEWYPTLLFHVFRKGRNFKAEAGAHITGITDASVVVAKNGKVAIETPAPLVLDAETPISSFRAVPMATVNATYSPKLVPPTMGPGTPVPPGSLPSPRSKR
ncbi:MAG TPA: hypothetical protein VMB20_14525 [Candidatus Acidoferrum sp.]|nr:hypothetical protein [Candidatus Acidoferrum sp.]